jgi:hypothetical protein
VQFESYTERVPDHVVVAIIDGWHPVRIDVGAGDSLGRGLGDL